MQPNGTNHPKFIEVRNKWQGITAFIIGGGPSVNKFPLSSLQNKSVIGVNNAYQFPITKICWFGDSRWHGWHRDKLENFQGLIATCHPQFRPNKNYVVFKRGKPEGIETRSELVSWNTCSGSSAINFAYHLGVKRIILIGFDMCSDEEGNYNYHKDHKFHHKGDPYKLYLNSFPKIAEDAKKLNLEILNANPESKIDVFPKISPKELLNF